MADSIATWVVLDERGTSLRTYIALNNCALEWVSWYSE